MPRYIIEQYELHSSKWEVEADSLAEAIVKHLLGDETEEVDTNNASDYLEQDETRGMPLSELSPQDQAELRERFDRQDWWTGADARPYIPVIRSVVMDTAADS